MPLPEVAGLADAECLANRRPHAVGGDHVARPDGADTVGFERDPFVGLAFDLDETVTVEDVRSGCSGMLEQSIVQFEAGGDGGELAGALERQTYLSAAR